MESIFESETGSLATWPAAHCAFSIAQAGTPAIDGDILISF
ncbi:hypothetical protein PAMC26510_12540 [Caballeronia sordidicola]|uniref:Uncharacterized protein n=1 Tax=Caballeronia sordidicola TaxID=196367 RepID=A0A242MXV8_CABSO|nr:hypothetical protein PAMC26510_12540 [Caballeronia sordidicola]